jgi:phosphoenolpyruvate carboxykinase (GTP)
MAPEWEDPDGVPISAILFGGRRATVVPLVAEAFNWQHGTFMASFASSETTAAAAGQVGRLRRDPMAMLPFCGYHMGDYFAHYLEVGARTDPEKLPKIFYVNWFRRDEKGRYLWPGFGENSRVLKWIFERCSGKTKAVDTPIGRLPTPGELDLTGLNLGADVLKELLAVNVDEWLAEVPLIKEHFETFGDRLPAALWQELADLEDRLQEARQ